jgi:SAM-dependent methyltransferase
MCAMYDNIDFLKKHFNQEHITEYLKQAQFAELIELKKQIVKLSKLKKSSISILDIGVGDGRLIKHLSQIEEVWERISNYDGIDNSQNCIDAANVLKDYFKLEKKVKIIKLDAEDLSKLNKKYDLIICTWFTPGNFYPNNFDFKNYANSKLKLDLSKNKKFEKIFKQAYAMLSNIGKLILGSVYLNNKNARKHQEAYYLKCGMHLITNLSDSFSATKEGYWSQRFTKKQIYDYFYFVNKSKIKIISLDTYKYAVQVIVSK